MDRVVIITKIRILMNNMFKSSDLLKELAPSQGEAVNFLYFSHMAEKINLIRNWDSPVSGKFGHLQQYLRNAKFHSIGMLSLHEPAIFQPDSSIFLLLPSFEDFRAYALIEYTESVDKYRGQWAKIARSLRQDFVRGYHYFCIGRILSEFMPDANRGKAAFETEMYLVVQKITNIFLKHDEVVVGRKGFGHLRTVTPFVRFKAFGLDPDVLKQQFNYHARRFTVLPFGPLVSDVEHVFRVNSLSHD